MYPLEIIEFDYVLARNSFIKESMARTCYLFIRINFDNVLTTILFHPCFTISGRIFFNQTVNCHHPIGVKDFHSVFCTCSKWFTQKICRIIFVCCQFLYKCICNIFLQRIHDRSIPLLHDCIVLTFCPIACAYSKPPYSFLSISEPS